jgi:hypothetical protein
VTVPPTAMLTELPPLPLSKLYGSLAVMLVVVGA